MRAPVENAQNACIDGYVENPLRSLIVIGFAGLSVQMTHFLSAPACQKSVCGRDRAPLHFMQLLHMKAAFIGSSKNMLHDLSVTPRVPTYIM